MFRDILVPVDGSVFAEAAIPMALALARATRARVRLAMVNEPVDLPPGVWADAFLENHARYLETLEEDVRARAGPDAEVSTTLLEGRVAEALSGEVGSLPADLVVMSTHGHGGLTRLWLGSVADAMLRQCPAPVLLIRPEEEEEEEDGVAVGPAEISHIVVPLDGSAFAEQELGLALDLAERFGASLTLLRTVSHPVLSSSYLPDTTEENRAFLKQAEEEARDYLDLVRSRCGERAASAALEVRVGARPAAGVLDFVAERGADLVIMASRARGGISRAVLGSTTDKVLRGSRTPILVIHR